MNVLLSNEIVAAITEELKNATSSVQVISAYCKEKTLSYLNNCINKDINEKRLLVRFRMDDIVKGSTDFSILEYAMSEGWKVYIRFDLHVKTYIVDNKRGIIGSANATNAGLSIGKAGNMELATLGDMEMDDLNKIESLYDGAILVDDHILENLSNQINKVNTDGSSKSFVWDSSIMNMFNPSIETLFSHELPEVESINEGMYLSFLDETYLGNLDEIKENFRWSNAYLWLIKVLKENEGELYFGAISSKLHDVLVSDPKPYRKEVKEMLSNLLSLIEQLGMEEVIIDRPNYSQRIRLKERV